jgi:hypothetical protein
MKHVLRQQQKLEISTLATTHPSNRLVSSTKMAGNPREQWERLQVILQNRARGGGGGFKFGGGSPIGGPAIALVALIAGGYAFSTALFNGEISWDLWCHKNGC